MVDSFGHTQSIYVDESVDEFDNGVNLRKKAEIAGNTRINKLE
jgi:hypothetical protein